MKKGDKKRDAGAGSAKKAEEGGGCPGDARKRRWKERRLESVSKEGREEREASAKKREERTRGVRRRETERRE